jgi:transcriptional regulator with XRE-family HTH domain
MVANSMAVVTKRKRAARVVKRDLVALKRTALREPNAGAVFEPPAEELFPRVGYQLRRERRIRRLRLKDVADKAGLSESLISKIENNKTSPSISTLHRLAKALGTSISALFAADESLDQVVQRRQERPIAGRVQSMAEWDGIEAEIIVPYVRGRLLEGFVFIMEPGGHSGGTLRHDGEECGYVLEGCLELVVDEETYILNPGDSFFFNSDRPHSYRNPGTVATRVIWVNTPPTY